MRESPACTQWQSPAGLIRKAAIVLCGSCSAEMAVSLITRCDSCTICLSRIAGVVVVGRVALEQLLGRQHHLVGGLAAAAAAAHAVGHHRQHAAAGPRVRNQRDLVLLVFAVTLVDAGGRGESVAFAHAAGGRARVRRARLLPSKDVLSSGTRRAPARLRQHSVESNLHSPERRLIELRMEHADLDALIDRTCARNAPRRADAAPPEEAPPRCCATRSRSSNWRSTPKNPPDDA